MLVCAERAQRTAGETRHSGRLLVEDALPIRARANVDRVLEDTGNGTVVLRRYEQDRVGGAETIAKSNPRCRNVLRILVEVLIVKSEIAYLDNLELEILRRDFLHRLR